MIGMINSDRFIGGISMEKKKPVWIKCLASSDCKGQQAVIMAIVPVDPLDASGAEYLEVGNSRLIRYQCLTCKEMFTIRQ